MYIYICIYVCVCVCVCIYMYIYICIYVCVCVCVCVRVHIYMPRYVDSCKSNSLCILNTYTYMKRTNICLHVYTQELNTLSGKCGFNVCIRHTHANLHMYVYTYMNETYVQINIYVNTQELNTIAGKNGSSVCIFHVHLHLQIYLYQFIRNICTYINAREYIGIQYYRGKELLQISLHMITHVQIDIHMNTQEFNTIAEKNGSSVDLWKNISYSDILMSHVLHCCDLSGELQKSPKYPQKSPR